MSACECCELEQGHTLECPLHPDYDGSKTVEFIPEAEKRSSLTDFNKGRIHIDLDVNSNGERVVNLYCFNQPVALSADDVIELAGLLAKEAVRL